MQKIKWKIGSFGTAMQRNFVFINNKLAFVFPEAIWLYFSDHSEKLWKAPCVNFTTIGIYLLS